MKPFWGTQGLKSGTDIKGGQCRLGVQCVPVGCLACPVEWTSVVLLPSLYSPFSISRFWSCGSGVTGPTPNYRGGSGSQGQDALGNGSSSCCHEAGRVSAWMCWGLSHHHTDNPTKEANPALPREGGPQEVTPSLKCLDRSMAGRRKDIEVKESCMQNSCARNV